MSRPPSFLLQVSVVAATVLGVSQVRAAAPEFTLRYDKPAAMWTEALPIGNGRIGAMVFGGTSEERLQINEARGNSAADFCGQVGRSGRARRAGDGTSEAADAVPAIL